MANRTRPRDAAVTGVAAGNLGTGTALDDTQVYSVDAVRIAPAEDQAPIAIPRVPTGSLQRSRGITGGYPVGVLTAAVVALLAVAAVLTLRDGGFGGSGNAGSGSAGVASFPPPPSFGAIQTAGPAVKPTTGHHGHGHGHGHGH